MGRWAQAARRGKPPTPEFQRAFAAVLADFDGQFYLTWSFQGSDPERFECRVYSVVGGVPVLRENKAAAGDQRELVFDRLAAPGDESYAEVQPWSGTTAGATAQSPHYTPA